MNKKAHAGNAKWASVLEYLQKTGKRMIINLPLYFTFFAVFIFTIYLSEHSHTNTTIYITAAPNSEPFFVRYSGVILFATTLLLILNIFSYINYKGKKVLLMLIIYLLITATIIYLLFALNWLYYRKGVSLNEQYDAILASGKKLNADQLYNLKALRLSKTSVFWTIVSSFGIPVSLIITWVYGYFHRRRNEVVIIAPIKFHPTKAPGVLYLGAAAALFLFLAAALSLAVPLYELKFLGLIIGIVFLLTGAGYAGFIYYKGEDKNIYKLLMQPLNLIIIICCLMFSIPFILLGGFTSSQSLITVSSWLSFRYVKLDQGANLLLIGLLVVLISGLVLFLTTLGRAWKYISITLIGLGAVLFGLMILQNAAGTGFNPSLLGGAVITTYAGFYARKHPDIEAEKNA